MSDEKAPPHQAVEGPEETLEPAREQAHEEPGLTGKLEQASFREKELTERLARLQADFDNYRRRAREESAQAASRGKGDLVKMLLPVLDNLDRALAHAEDEGLKLLARGFHSTLSSAGLVMLEPAGERFDAKIHEAIASEAKDGVKAGTVITVIEKGYVLDGRVVRPARVVVAV